MPIRKEVGPPFPKKNSILYTDVGDLSKSDRSGRFPQGYKLVSFYSSYFFPSFSVVGKIEDDIFV